MPSFSERHSTLPAAVPADHAENHATLTDSTHRSQRNCYRLHLWPRVSASIADNLRVGGAEASDAELVEAARLAEAHEFILAHPQGYTTQIGERGAMLARRAPTAWARPGALEGPADPDPGRGHQRPLRGDPGQGPDGVAQRHAKSRHARHRASPFYGASGGSDPGFDSARIVERGSFMELLARHGPFAGLRNSARHPAAFIRPGLLNDQTKREKDEASRSAAQVLARQSFRSFSPGTRR